LKKSIFVSDTLCVFLAIVFFKNWVGSRSSGKLVQCIVRIIVVVLVVVVAVALLQEGSNCNVAVGIARLGYNNLASHVVAHALGHFAELEDVFNCRFEATAISMI
jgi:hypothetical protein